MDTRPAPGAAPAACRRRASVVGRPATMPLTWVPWPPPEMVSVSTTPGTATTQSVLVVDSSRHTLFRLATTALLPSSLRKYGCVGSTPESMTATETPLPSRASPFAPVRVSTASAPRVAVFEVSCGERDRGVALEVGDARLGPGRLDLAGGARRDDDADPLELGDGAHARRRRPPHGRRRCRCRGPSASSRRTAWPAAGPGSPGRARGGRGGLGGGGDECRRRRPQPLPTPRSSADRPAHGTPRGVTAMVRLPR